MVEQQSDSVVLATPFGDLFLIKKQELEQYRVANQERLNVMSGNYSAFIYVSKFQEPYLDMFVRRFSQLHHYWDVL